jgi:alkylhydroperoxidase family enzyme
MTWLTSVVSVDASFDDVFGLRPDLHDSFQAFYGLFWEQRLVDPVLLEVARLRIAQLNGCTTETTLRYRPAIDAGLSEDHALAARDGNPGALASPLQGACLGLAEKFVLDVHSINDDDVAAVRDVIGEGALVALIEAMALFDGFTRFAVILGVGETSDSVTIVDVPTSMGRSRGQR